MTTLEVRVAASPDDTFRTTAASAWDNTNSLVAAGKNNVPDTQGSSMRFLNITVPWGSTITVAYIQFTCNFANTQTTVRTNIFGNDEDSAVAPTSAATFDALVKTTAFAAWDSLISWAVDDVNNSASLVAAVQELIDREAWESGDPMQFMWLDDGSDTNARRRAYSYDDDPTKAALLHIEYTENPPGQTIFPTQAITRVTNLIHRFNRTAGIYTLECALGEVTSDFGLPQWLSEPQPSVMKRSAAAPVPPAGLPLPTPVSVVPTQPIIGPAVERGGSGGGIISPIQVTPVGVDEGSRDAIAHSQALAGMQDPARLVPRGDTARFGGPDPGFIASVLNVSRFRPAEELVEGLRPDIRRRGPQVPGRIGTTRQGQQTRLPVAFNPADITGGDFGNLGDR